MDRQACESKTIEIFNKPTPLSVAGRPKPAHITIDPAIRSGEMDIERLVAIDDLRKARCQGRRIRERRHKNRTAFNRNEIMRAARHETSLGTTVFFSRMENDTATASAMRVD